MLPNETENDPNTSQISENSSITIIESLTEAYIIK